MMVAVAMSKTLQTILGVIIGTVLLGGFIYVLLAMVYEFLDMVGEFLDMIGKFLVATVALVQLTIVKPTTDFIVTLTE